MLRIWHSIPVVRAVVCKCGARTRRCCYSSATRPAAVLLLARYSYAAVLLLARYSPSGRAATRPLLVQRPCCYSSATRPAAVLLLARYSPAAVLLLVRYSPGGRAATRPLLARWPCCYLPATRPVAVLLLARYYSSGGRAATRPGSHWWAAATGVCEYPQNKRLFLRPIRHALHTRTPLEFPHWKTLRRPARGNSAVVHWWNPKDGHAHGSPGPVLQASWSSSSSSSSSSWTSLASIA